MNLKIFFELFSEGHTDHMIWESLLQEDKPIQVVLTLHLMCENFLEAWICSYMDIEDLFKEDVDADKVKFSMQFQNKLKLAQRLGLPMAAYDAINKLNLIRNKFAHKLNYNVIEKSQIDSIVNCVNAVKSKTILHNVEEEGAEVYSDLGEVKTRYQFDSKITPNTVKLVILYSFLIRKLVCGIHLLKK